MSVEIERSQDDETIVEAIYIDGELPNIEELSSVKSIRYLSINNITDSKKLQEFLSSIPINTIKEIYITSCNMEAVSEEFFEQLHFVENIYIKQCQGINYNEIMKKIPNKEQVKSIYLWADKQEENSIEPRLLEAFKNLSVIGLRNCAQMNMDEFYSYLIKAQKLEQLVLEGDIENLDFISGVDLEHISIIDEDLDLSLITPEVAKTHNNIYFSIKEGKIITDSLGNGQGYKLQLPLECITRIEEMRETINGADDVRMLGTAVHIDDKKQLQTLIENKDFLLTAPWVTITVPHMGIIAGKQLEEIGIGERDDIRVMDSECDEGVEERFEYTTNEYKQLYDRIQEIVGDIPQNITDLQKFVIIYKRLGSTISYDYQACEIIKALEKDLCIEYDEEHIRNAANLVGGLIKGTCVCAGYSDILYNCLNTVGIEACKITGKTEEEGHAWNKVKLDGVWYNVDLTWDCKDITQHNARGIENCLRSDQEFQEGHEQTDGKKVECNHDYPREEVVRAFRFAERFSDRALDAEYETIGEEPSFFDKLKARVMTLFGKRKMIVAPQEEISTVPTEAEKRKLWMEKSGIVLENGEEISKIDSSQLAASRPLSRDRENEL